MKSTKKIAQHIHIEEWVAIAVAVVALTVNIVVFEQYALKESALTMLRYVTFNKEHFYSMFFLFLYVIFIGRVYLRLAKTASDLMIYKKKVARGTWGAIGRDMVRPIRFMLPLAIVAAPIFALLGSMSYALRLKGRDLALLAGDKALLGQISFLSWPTYSTSPILEEVIMWSYFSLGVVMSITFGALFLRTRKEYRRGVLAFICSLIIAFPVYGAVPCQDPNNFFIRNIRNNTFSEEVQQALDAYHPSPLIAKNIAKIAKAETGINVDSAVPISCFPSMHATWSLLAVYYLARIWRWTLLVSIPWALLLMTGGIFLAQHYVVDYLAAAVVAALAIALAHVAITWEATWPWKKIHNNERKEENIERIETRASLKRFWRTIVSITKRSKKNAKK